MPLSTVQAAGYIEQRAPRDSEAQYPDDLQQSNFDKSGLLSHEEGHLCYMADHFRSPSTHETHCSGLVGSNEIFDTAGIPIVVLHEFRGN
jgi:hypothetical protein